MLSTRTLLLSLATLPAVLAPATAHSAQATFSVKLEAHRTVAWNHPRVERGGDCNGKRWVEGRGSDDFLLWSGSTGRLVVEGDARALRDSSFGTEGPGRILVASEPPEAKSVITRTRQWRTGTTGGWCGGARQDPAPVMDCGTRLAPFTYAVSTYDGAIRFRETLESRANEEYGFRACDLNSPEGVPHASFPPLEQPLPLRRLFDKRDRTIVITAKQSYADGPSPGSPFSATAEYTWTMTLKRVKDLTPRSENG